MKPIVMFTSLALAVSLTGCKYFREGVSQTVSVYSFPSGADVVVSGETVGTTPMEIDLGRKITHRIVIEKEGYQPFSQSINPTVNEWGKALIRFQIAKDLGFYYDLKPAPVEVQLDPDLLPARVGLDPFGEMSELVLEADSRRERGEIDPVEHKYIVDRIIKFYTE